MNTVEAHCTYWSFITKGFYYLPASDNIQYMIFFLQNVVILFQW